MPRKLHPVIFGYRGLGERSQRESNKTRREVRILIESLSEKKGGHTEVDEDLKVPQTGCKNRTKNMCV